jgi:hypothetical protein
VSVCSRPGCGRIAQYGSHRCPEHNSWIPGWFKAWFVFTALLALAVVGVAVWAVIELVSWVTSR